jgi:sulfopyruvate decarboxylase TPP-binding subunit
MSHQQQPFGASFVTALEECGATHLITLPSTNPKHLYEALSVSRLRLIPVCREGESFGIAAGLYCGGHKPVIMIQNTGLMESGDSIRGLALPLGIPMPLYIGYRGYVGNAPMTDTAAIYLEPLLKMWGISYHLLISDDDLGLIRRGYEEAYATSRPVAVLIAAK